MFSWYLFRKYGDHHYRNVDFTVLYYTVLIFFIFPFNIRTTDQHKNTVWFGSNYFFGRLYQAVSVVYYMYIIMDNSWACLRIFS